MRAPRSQCPCRERQIGLSHLSLRCLENEAIEIGVPRNVGYVDAIFDGESYDVAEPIKIVRPTNRGIFLMLSK